MPSTYSNLKIQLMATGENNTTWGDVTNLNLGTALEEAIVGSADVTFASANVTLTLANTNASQTARNMRLRCTGTTGGARDLVVPSIEKPYIVRNDCADTITVKTAAGTGIAVPAGKTMWVYSDGTNVVDAVTHLSSLTLGTDLSVADGGTGTSTFTANGLLYGNGSSALQVTAAGTTGQVLVGNTGSAPSWATLTSSAVTSISFGSTGLTPSTPTQGAVTVAGTLGVANGGTGTSTQFTAGSVVFAGASGVYTQDNANLFWNDSSNRLGVGTATPGVSLDVVGGIRGQAIDTTGSAVLFSSAGGGTLYYSGSGVAVLRAYSDGAGAAGTLTFNASGAENMRITSAGDVGIGTSSPAVKLHVSATAPTVLIEGSANSDAGVQTKTPLADFKFGAGIGSATNCWNVYDLAANAERLRIDSAGNVGIGTSSPFASASFTGLTVGGSKRGLVAVKNAAGADTGYVFAGTDNSVNLESAGAGPVAINTVNAQPVTITTNTAERMRITSTGDVGIGTSSPGAKLSVVTNTATAGMEDSFSITNTVDSNVFIRVSGTANGDKKATIGPSTSTALVFNTADTERMRIDSSGNVGIGATTITPIFGRTLQISNGSTEGSLSIVGSTGAGYVSTSGAVFGVTGRGGMGLGLGTNDVERMRIDTSGNVGIGTSSPDAKLTVEGAYGIVSVKSTTGSKKVVLGGDAFTDAFTGTTTAHNFSVIAGGNIVSTFTTGGNVGIGTSSPAYKLDVAGAVQATDYRAPATSVFFLTGDEWRFRTTGGSERMRIDSSGNVGIGTINPAYRLEVVSGAADKIRLFNTVGNGNTIDFLDQAWQAQIVGSAGNLLFNTGGLTERMRIDTSGNVGIGTTGGTYKLELSSASAFVASFSGPTNAFLQVTDGTVTGRMQGQGSLFAMGSSSNHPLTFITNVTERARIDTSGNLLVGTTSVISSAKVSIDSGAGPSIGSKVNATTALGHIIFENPNGVVGQIYTNGSATVYDTASDARLKENVSDADDAASLIDAIQVRKFDWKVDGKHQRYGFVAQELLPVVPEAVSVPADPDDRMGVDYSKLVPMLVKEIQSLRARVAQLEGN